MKRALIHVLVVLIVTLSAGRSRAVTHGQFDGEDHPYVGLILFDNNLLCSGSLISPTVVLTAGHCTDGAALALVFFDSVVVGNPNLAAPVAGTPITHPDFCASCGHGLGNLEVHDVGVVVLDQPVSVGRYATLPPLGFVDTLPMHTALTIVGYGVRDRPPHGGDEFGVRFSATSLLIAANESLSDEFIKFSLNHAKGKGGACFGDSGGPNLLQNTDVVIAVTSFGTNPNCVGVGRSARVDVPENRSFIVTHPRAAS